MLVSKIYVSKTEIRVEKVTSVTSGMVGAEVDVYFDRSWNGYTKTYVWEHNGEIKVDAACSGIIPHEVVAESGGHLRFGVYGTKNGTKVTPTLWCNVDTVRNGADPSGDESTNESLPVWAQIRDMIGNLDDLDTEEKENLVAAVNEALTKVGTGSNGDGYKLPIGGDELGGVKNGGNVFISKNEGGAMYAPELSVDRFSSDSETGVEISISHMTGEGAVDVEIVHVYDGKDGHSGPAGEAGGYYTPAVTKPDDETIQFDFTPSKEGMPAVDPVQVKLPVPDSGGNANVVEPAEDDIPVVHFIVDGGMPFTKDEGDVQALMRYISKTVTIERYVTAKVQGGSSATKLDYKKRNWTIKIYKDNTYEDKEKLSFKGWPAMNKFVLKAGWVIPGHLRNVGAAKIWGQIMRSRSDYDSLPEELRNSPNQGATDGFHVRVFVNGMYWGIYDWIVAKDQLFGQDKDNTAHSILNSELNNQPTCAFATTSPTISGNWSEELLDDMTKDTQTSMENWIKFVAGSTDDEFVANAENYFDVQSVIDAICFDRIIMTVDNMCRNQIVFKYDTKWFMGKWDLDAILGLPPVAGQAWYTYDTAYQEGYVAYKDYSIINMLYDRTEKLFLPRFKENYWRLRSGPLSESNLVEVFGRMSDRLRYIDGLLAEENASTTGNGEFTGMPNVNKDTIQQIREMVVKRCAFMDGVVENMTEPVSCTGISLSAETLTFTTEGSQTLTATVTPDGCTDAVTWESDNTSVATVVGGVVTAIANGSATITAKCGEYSATCTVSVSGIAEPIPCTGITFDKTELSFTEEGSQTVVATVTPADTTDDIVWNSDNTGVATVADGVVTSVGNGSAVITATCGEHSASCIVSVSGIESGESESEMAFDYGSINGNTGEPITSTDDIITGYIDITPYIGKTINMTVYGSVGYQKQKIIFYDADKNFISSLYTNDNNVVGTVPSNVKYARFGVLKDTTSILVCVDDLNIVENLFSTVGAVVGSYYDALTGAINDYADYTRNRMDITSERYYFVNVLSAAFFDSANNFIGGTSRVTDNEGRFIAVPENAAWFGYHWFTSNQDSVVVDDAEESIIFTLTNNLN